MSLYCSVLNSILLIALNRFKKTTPGQLEYHEFVKFFDEQDQLTTHAARYHHDELTFGRRARQDVDPFPAWG